MNDRGNLSPSDMEIVSGLLQSVYLETPESALLAIEKPLDWQHRAKRYDWRLYLTEEIAAAWDDLPLEAKAVAYVIAKERMRFEE